jgi:hypothetical protein
VCHVAAPCATPDKEPQILSVVEEGDLDIVEGRPDDALIVRPRDVARVVEVCLSARVRRALLYPATLPAAFFDLSSGESGEILQTLQDFGITVVCAPDSVRFSSRFHEALGRDFLVFDTRKVAREWLARGET